ncbi:uncharacterized protein LOC122505125 [Leptopilina heterotoma]|uniref:uncharacterized protein LOC122505125 n=1 Tax=Leptopilina heterotoma TaxID=63436 RepID=UPI001CA85FF9|nr:uncharacterized protein LOC122505125 [Leptopilina heterotoma]
MFLCRFCDHQTVILSKHITHQSFHRNLSRYKHCGYNACKMLFESEESLKMHVNKKHPLKSRCNLYETMSQKLVQQNSTFICSVINCQKEHFRYQTFIKHLKEHIRAGENVKCPYDVCNKKYSNVSSFTSHLSRHKNSSLSTSTELTIMQNVEIAQCFDQENHPDTSLANHDINTNEIHINSSNSINDHICNNLFEINLAQLYLKLEAQFLVPVSTIQFFIEELENIDNQRLNVLKENLNKQLSLLIINDETDKIVEAVFSTDPLQICKSNFETNYKRRKFYKKHFTYVKPELVSLGKIRGKKAHFHYVPIIETLKALFKNKSFDINLKLPQNDTQILKDFTDGLMFKSNPYFLENPEALQIILYTDSFEVVNPIGSSRKKHKILAVYFTLGNLPDYLRYQMNSIQLVLLCKEKEFCHEKVFGRLVKDLIKLETEGFEAFPNKIVKAGVIFIANDNLGAHGLGGYQENFSISIYFCRFCLITRKEFVFNKCDRCQQEREIPKQFDDNSQTTEEEIVVVEDELNEENGICEEEDENEEEEEEDENEEEEEEDENDNEKEEDENDDEEEEDEEDDTEEEEDDNVDNNEVHRKDYIPYSYKKRTVTSYLNALKNLKKLKHYQGIKFNSVFNSLKSFHVCNSGLPPCMAHDLLEGISAYDLSLILDYFVSKGWFTYEFLNSKIETFKYSPTDQRDKPAIISKKKKKIVGNAWQLLTLIRLLPFYIGYKIDTNDEVWEYFLKLSEIVEIVCAPQIHLSFIPYLADIINEYLTLRKKLFPTIKLRPKHHYLTHYPEVIRQLGPVKKLFTLRFESKHTFFKRVMRNIKCFKNVTLSLTEKHELLQSLLRSGAGLRCELRLNEETDFFNFRYSAEIQQAIFNAEINSSLTECASAELKGYNYKKGGIVAVRQTAYQENVEMGRIAIILCDDKGCLYFVLEILKTTFQHHLRLYRLDNCLRYECIAIKNLMTYEPLHIYVENTTSYVKINHGLVTTSL